MKKIATASIQILPLEKSETALKAIDEAINAIHASGIRYLVCPFETVMEGEYAEIQDVMQKAISSALEISDEIVVHCKWHISASKDLFIDDKLEKYR